MGRLWKALHYINADKYPYGHSQAKIHSQLWNKMLEKSSLLFHNWRYVNMSQTNWVFLDKLYISFPPSLRYFTSTLKLLWFWKFENHYIRYVKTLSIIFLRKSQYEGLAPWYLESDTFIENFIIDLTILWIELFNMEPINT